jgi:Ca-activated chloride channel family protein
VILEMVKKLSPESSVFKPVLKLEYCFGVDGLILALVNPKLAPKWRR